MNALSTLYAPPHATAGDRLGLALFFAAILHALLLLGISLEPFDIEPPDNAPTLEITLVNSRSEQAPEEADYLAQANQLGDEGTRPKEVQAVTPPPLPQAALAPPDPLAQAVPPQTEAEPAPPTKPMITVEREAAEENQIAPSPQAQAAPVPAENPPSATQLISRGMEIASLNAQVNASMQAYAERPRQKFISTSTQEYKYASYMEAWRAKVERVGNFNYPDEAKRANLSGSLILDVALNPDGSINNIALRRSSGYDILDNAAMRIVKLAAPYAPFPEAIRAETDILHITRTWRFLPSNRLFSQ